MKKLMFFVQSFQMGGSEKACVRMANSLCDRYDVTICTYFGDGPLRRELNPRIKVQSAFPRFVRGIARLTMLPPAICRKLFVRGEYDYEVAVGDGLASRIVAGSKNPHKFSWIHINLGVSGTRYSEKNTAMYRSFEKIICVSEVNKACFCREMRFSENVSVAYTPIDTDALHKKAGEKTKPEKCIIAAVGRLEEIKGFHRLIEAAANLREHDFEIHIYGDGTQRSRLETAIAEYGLQNKVFLEGMSENPYPAVNCATALICPSISESFGFSVAEAMALKTPVIATKCGGTEEIIQNPKQGLLCENSTEGIEAGLRLFLEGKTEIDVEAAYQRACDFSVTSCAEAFARLMEG